LGNVLHALGRSEEAALHFEHAIAEDPGFVEAHNNLGNALKSLQRCEAIDRVLPARNIFAAELR